MITDYRNVDVSIQAAAGDWANWTARDPFTLLYHCKPVSARALERAVRVAMETDLAKANEGEMGKLQRLLVFAEVHALRETLENDIARTIRRALEEGLSELDIVRVMSREVVRRTP